MCKNETDALDTIYIEKRVPEGKGIQDKPLRLHLTLNMLLIGDVLVPANNFSWFLQSKSVVFVDISVKLNYLKLAISKLKSDDVIILSLLNCMPCVLNTYSRIKVPCLLTCSRDNVLCVLMYSHADRSCMLTCQLANMPWVPCLAQLVLPRDHLPPSFASSVSFWCTFFSYTAIFVEVVHTVDKF